MCIKKTDWLPLALGTDLLAFAFLGKNPAVFAGKNPRILFMAKRQKAQEAVRTPCLLRQPVFFEFNEYYINVTPSPIKIISK